MNGAAGKNRWVTQWLQLLGLWLGVSDWAFAFIRYTIPEEMPKSSLVGNVMLDLGLDLQQLQARNLRVVSGGSRKYFEADLNTGKLLVNERIDREELCATLSPCVLSLQIIAENPLELYGVAVEIQDINDNDPVFLSKQMRLEISESVSPGARFPLESAQDPDVGINSLQTYQLSSNQHYALNVQTGGDNTKYAELVLEKTLDREQQKEILLILTALDGGNPPRSATLQVLIDVLDANDNTPIFNQSIYKASVREDTPLNTLVARTRAFDLDEGPNGEIIYSFSSHTPARVRQLFALDSDTGELRLNGLLDFEETKFYEIYVQAKDKGTNPSETHCKILVEIIDVNDNIPEITVTSVYSPVPEDAAPGTVIALLSVTDQDSGQIRYSVVEESKLGTMVGEVAHDLGLTLADLSSRRLWLGSEESKRYFAINLDSGALMVNEKIDRETLCGASSLCILPVQVVIENPLELFHLEIEILDLNDNSPNFVTPWLALRVAESAATGSRLPLEGAHDADVGTNAVSAYQLSPNPHFILDIKNVKDGKLLPELVLDQPLDREKQSEHQLILTAYDGGDPVLSGTRMDVTKLAAANLQVLSDSDFQYFSVNVNTGIIIINDRIDREQLCGQNLRCFLHLKLAIENPVEFYRIEVEILDINDNAPEFSSSTIVLQIYELAALGARFPIPHAQDPDIGTNTLQTYHLSINENFSLNVKARTDGTKFPELVLEKTLDRERVAVHNLILTAEDGGTFPRSSTVQIAVHVLDANDNHPVFDKPTYNVRLVENSPPGTLVIKLNATDFDEGSNGQVRYSLSSHNSEALCRIFAIDNITGEIRVQGSLDFEEASIYEIEVEAKDMGSPTMEQHCSVIVEVTDVNDNVPEVILTSFSSSMSEDAPPGTVVAVIHVKDRDSGDQGKVQCDLSKNLPFKLRKDFEHQYSLLIGEQLDRENSSQYNITICAFDLGNPPLLQQTSFSITLADINDNPPQFDRSFYEVIIEENNPVGVILLKVSATDADKDQNSQLSYIVLTSPGQELIEDLTSFISINPTNGEVFAESSFDYECTNHFQFQEELLLLLLENPFPLLSLPSQAAASFLGGCTAPLGSSQSHQIHYSIPEDQDPGSYVGNIAKDLGVDVRTLRARRLQLVSEGMRQYFQVNLADGMLLVNERLDREMLCSSSPRCSFPFQLVLEKPLQLNRVEVEILDVNDNAPRFPKDTVSLEITEVANLGTRLRLEVAEDQDTGSNSIATYELSPNEHFALSINIRGDGVKIPEIVLEKLLDREKAATHHLILTALDSGNPVQSGTVQQTQPNTDWRFSQAQRPGTSGSQNGDENGTWPNNQFDTEMLQAMILASANEAAAAAAANPDGNSTLGGGATAGTMGLSARYGPQFTLQHVPDYRQNVYIPGSTATLSNSAGKRDGKPAASGGGNKKKSGKKEKK
ncbi:protocadherin gamma-C5-like [Crotalus adamanteus]|uniref:Protocadherin gamma-C5-like n=1 Tax=Crotalus adamanteus TaxID=8729 RepID=A0AAW1BNR9_CROAD